MRTLAITLSFPEKCLFGFFILEKQFASQKICFLYYLNFLLLCISFLYCMNLHPYSHDCFSKILRPFCVSRNWWIIVVFLQSNSLRIMIVFLKYWHLLQPCSCDCFSKISRTFYASRKSWIIVVFLHACWKKNYPFFWWTLFYSTPFSWPLQTDRITDGGMNQFWLGR
jgi:hypothetical protein